MAKVNYSIIEKIPVSDHVYKYLLKKVGCDTLKTDRYSFLSSVVASSLQRNKDIIIKRVSFTKIFQIEITENKYLRSGVFLSIVQGQVFNDLVDKLFREELYTDIDKHGDKNATETIKRNLKYYNINEDDIKFETLYRDYTRKKAKKTTKNTA